MADRATIDLFCEDEGHRSLLEPIVCRLARETEIPVAVRVVTARGGAPRVLEEIDAYRAAIARRVRSIPDAMVVAVDGNCVGHDRRSEEVRRRIGGDYTYQAVLAVPEAHIERWYLADEAACGRVIGGQPAQLPEKCERDLYKRLLADRVASAGLQAVFGGIEFGREIAEAMDFFQAGKADRSLKRFIDDLRAALKRLTR